MREFKGDCLALAEVCTLLSAILVWDCVTFFD